MVELRRNLLVGSFVAVGIAIFAVLVILFGRAPIWVTSGNTYPIHVRFRSAVGIRPDTLVNVMGKTIGRVDKVEFVDAARFTEGVRVVLAIESKYQIHRGSRAETAEPGIGQGRPPIEIVPGPPDGDILPPGAEIPGTMATAMEAMFPPRIINTLELTAGQIGEAASALKPVLEDLHGILQARTPTEVDRVEGTPGNLASAAARLDQLLKHFNAVLGDPQTESNLKQSLNNFHTISEDGKTLVSDLKIAGGNVKEASGEIRQLIAKGDTTLTHLDENVTRVARSAVDGLDQAHRVMQNLSETTQLINKGEGTLGKLVRDDRLYESSVLTFQRLSEVFTEFRGLVEEWKQGKIRVAF